VGDGGFFRGGYVRLIEVGKKGKRVGELISRGCSEIPLKRYLRSSN